MEEYIATYQIRKTSGVIDISEIVFGLLNMAQYSFEAGTGEDALRMAEEYTSIISKKTGQKEESIILERLVCLRDIPVPFQPAIKPTPRTPYTHNN